MYLQVQNTSKEKFNQFKTTKQNVVKDIKQRGWKISDCTIKELQAELIDNKYQGADGKNVGGVSRQYVTRAKSNKTLNKPNNAPKTAQALKVA